MAIDGSATSGEIEQREASIGKTVEQADGRAVQLGVGTRALREAVRDVLDELMTLGEGGPALTAKLLAGRVGALAGGADSLQPG